MREKIERALQRWLDAALARIDGRLDNVSLRSKLYSIFVFCVLCPLVLTDSIVMWMLYDTEHKSRQQTMENTAEAVAYELNTTIDAAVDLAQMIYQNRYINEFLQGSYPTPLDYYIAYNDLMEESLYEVVMGNSAYQTVIYADNPDFINGGYFARLSSVQGESWYQEFNDSGRSSMVTTYYYSKEAIGYRTRKTISVIRRMDYQRAGSRDILKLDLDYSGMSRALDNARYANTVYVCVGKRILLSNDGRGGINTPFEALTSEIRKQAGVRRPLPLNGTSWDVYVMPESIELLGVIRRNLALLALLLAANIWLPLLFMRLINHLPAGGSVPFVHSHKKNEEIYAVLDGKGRAVIDGERVELSAGDWVRISPQAKRQFFAAEDSSISFACIQVRENSLEGYTMDDAVVEG